MTAFHMQHSPLHCPASCRELRTVWGANGFNSSRWPRNWFRPQSTIRGM